MPIPRGVMAIKEPVREKIIHMVPVELKSIIKHCLPMNYMRCQFKIYAMIIACYLCGQRLHNYQ